MSRSGQSPPSSQTQSQSGLGFSPSDRNRFGSAPNISEALPPPPIGSSTSPKSTLPPSHYPPPAGPSPSHAVGGLGLGMRGASSLRALPPSAHGPIPSGLGPAARSDAAIPAALAFGAGIPGPASGDLLANERARAEMHKAHYESVRARLGQAQEEITRLKDELANLVQAKLVVEDTFSKVTDEYKKELLDLQARHADLRTQVLTPQKLEMIRMEITDELERAFAERAIPLEQEAQSARAELSKLRYENTYLKSELEHEQREHPQTIETMKLQYEAEVGNLRKERDALLAKQETDSSEDTRKLRSMQRELAASQARIKSLNSELDEVRARFDAERLQAESSQRALQRQCAEHSSTIKQLQIEREALKTQAEKMTGELREAADMTTTHLKKQHELETEAARTKARLLELEHQVKLSSSAQQLELLKHKQEQEEARERAQQDCDAAQSECEQLRARVKQLEQEAIENEKEITRRAEAARQLEMQRVIELENNKMELEGRLTSLERRRQEAEEAAASTRTRLENEAHVASEARAAAETQVLALQGKLGAQTQLEERARDAIKQAADAKRKLGDTEIEMTALMQEQNQLLQTNAKLGDKCKRLEAEARAVQEHARQELAALQHDLQEKRNQWATERQGLLENVKQLETAISQLEATDARTKHIFAKKKAKYVILIKALRNKLDIANKALEQVAVENEALKQNVPQETHLRLQRQLRDLYRRHIEFRNIIHHSIEALPGLQLGHSQSHPALHASASRLAPLGSAASAEFPSLDQLLLLESDHERDMQLVKQRLEHLDRVQREQLAGLATLNSPPGALGPSLGEAGSGPLTSGSS